MSIQDYKLVMCDAQSLASTTTSGVAVGSVIDLGAAGKDGWGNSLTEAPGIGGSLYWNIRVNTVLSAHAPTVSLQHAAAVGSSSALTSGVTIQSVRLPASTAAGKTFSVTLSQAAMARYLRCLVTAGHNSQTGALDIWISNCPADPYAKDYK